MSDQPRTIYRRPSRSGSPPTMQTIQRHDGSLNTRRLRAASPLMTAHPNSHSRRAFGWRGFLLLIVAALVVIAILALAASRPAPAHGQYMAPTVTPPTPPTPHPTPTLVAIIDPWPAMECAPGAACYYALLPLVAHK